MKILYLSTVCSKRILHEISQQINYPLSSITDQKFHRLLLNGFLANSVSVETLSTLPVNNKDYRIVSKDQEDGIVYNYIKNHRISLFRYIYNFFYTLIFVLKWHKSNKRTKHVVICDVLSVSLALGVLVVRLFSSCKVVGLMTDMPGLMVGCRNDLQGRLVKKINLYALRGFDGYIFLTEQMNVKINVNHCPYMIMEGLVDVNMGNAVRKSDSHIRNVIYAGSIHERYGIDLLVKAFMKVKGDNYRLSLYGKHTGTLNAFIEEAENIDKRIHYFGVKPNSEIVKEELSAALLVNPRPTQEEFTKYSFPSKNMEYMVSGTPVLTTALPGMPSEYYDYLFICKDETVDGFADAMRNILQLSEDVLLDKGLRAKEFVLSKKNNIVQSQRIINFLVKLTNC